MNKEALHKYIMENAEFETSAEVDDLEVRGNALASGDDAEDKAEEDRIIAEVNSGNVWAWACVKVTCLFRHWTGDDYLGGCSYDSQESFEQPGGYYDDMKSQAVDDVIQQIYSYKNALAALEKEIGESLCPS